MVRRVRFLKRLLADLPRQLRLAYCLMRDDRVPVTTRAAFAASLAIILSPFIDTRKALPFIGEVDVLALTLLALRLFVAACPEQVVADSQQLIIEQRSRFDEDLRTAERALQRLIARFTGRGDGQSGGDQELVDAATATAAGPGGARAREEVA